MWENARGFEPQAHRAIYAQTTLLRFGLGRSGFDSVSWHLCMQN